MTQNARILRWLEAHDGLTQLEAFNGVGCCRLSERIREIERLGFVISHTAEKAPNGATVTRYRLIEEQLGALLDDGEQAGNITPNGHISENAGDFLDNIPEREVSGLPAERAA